MLQRVIQPPLLDPGLFLADPFLKWAGGKTQILSQLEPAFPKIFGDYFEPFMGSAAVFFYLRRSRGKFPAHLFDANPELVNTFKVVRDEVDSLLRLLTEHRKKHGTKHYYHVRQKELASLTEVERAGRLIYLNKTCYNGLYRVNQKGQFNVPIGSYKKPSIFYEANLRAVSRVLEHVTVEMADFSDVLDSAKAGDFVYLDPPYYTETAGFTTYSLSVEGRYGLFRAPEQMRQCLFEISGVYQSPKVSYEQLEDRIIRLGSEIIDAQWVSRKPWTAVEERTPLMSTNRTLADYFDENLVKVVGAPSYSWKRKERLKALIVDGKPLGSYELDVPRNKEETKHFNEIQWLGISLVGCDADLELKSITTLQPRDGKATADFEAKTKSGDTVRIELCGVVYDDEKIRFKVLDAIGKQAEKLVVKSGNSGTIGEYVVRFVNVHLVTESDISNASKELADFIVTDSNMRQISATMFSANANRSTLQKLDTHVAHLSANGAARVMIEGPIRMLDPERAQEILRHNHGKKATKVQAYGDGKIPVWLVFVAESHEQSLIAASLVEHLRNEKAFDPHPFARVLLGCFTLGITFDESKAEPRYTSLTTTG